MRRDHKQISRTVWQMGLCWGTLSAALLSVGCLGSDWWGVVSHPVPKSASPRQIKTGGAGQMLGQAGATLQPSELMARVNELLTANDEERARHFIERFPDVALETLRSTPATEAATVEIQEVARVYDRLSCAPQGAGSWEAFLQERASNPEKYRTYDNTRQLLSAAVEHNQATPEAISALTAAVPKDSGGVLLDIDAAGLAGAALLQCERPGEAIKVLARGVKLAEKYPHQEAYLLLLLSDAQRREGKGDKADASWLEAVQCSGNLLSQAEPLADPALLHRASYLRPVTTNWPAPAVQQVCRYNSAATDGVPISPEIVQASHANGPERPGAGEAQVWTCIGECRMYRHEPQLALMAFKRAESSTDDIRLRYELQLQQAEAFLRLKQPIAASAVLVKLTQTPAPITNRATAMLGALKLQEGASKQALALLHRAVEEKDTIDWPGRGQAEGNLGVAYLMNGDEAAGLRWMHSAQRRFEAQGDSEALKQSLENEAIYFDHANKKHEAAAVHERLKAIATPHS